MLSRTQLQHLENLKLYPSLCYFLISYKCKRYLLDFYFLIKFSLTYKKTHFVSKLDKVSFYSYSGNTDLPTTVTKSTNFDTSSKSKPGVIIPCSSQGWFRKTEVLQPLPRRQVHWERFLSSQDRGIFKKMPSEGLTAGSKSSL